MAIKTAAARPWKADGERTADTWYEPYTEQAAVARGVRFTLSVEGVDALCTPGDEDVLAEVLRAVDDVHADEPTRRWGRRSRRSRASR